MLVGVGVALAVACGGVWLYVLLPVSVCVWALGWAGMYGCLVVAALV